MKEYNDINKQTEKSGFSFKFAGSLSIRCDKVNASKCSSNIKLPDWLRYKTDTINPKNID